LSAVSGLWDTMEPHLVVHLADETWQALFTKDHMSVGRADDNDIVIPDSSVSVRHATIDRAGNDFVIRDAHSDNGVWVGKQRVDSHTLQAGDVVSLGRAKLVFKGGFTQADLTLISAPGDRSERTRLPVVFVPGLGGSELWLGSERVFPTPRVLISNPELLSLRDNPGLEARRIVGDVVIVPGIIKQEQYSRLGDYLENGLGYTRGKDLLEFPYDWRRDIRSSAKKLAQAIDEWDPGAPVIIIGHSLGTLVTRYYVERVGGKRKVERIVLMGGPQYGTPKALSAMLTGPGILPFGISNDRIRNVMAHYPTSYQILPVYPSVFDQTGQQIDVMDDDRWLPEHRRPYLKIAKEFRRELGTHSSVPAVSIFGYGYTTAVRANVERRPDGSWQKVSFVEKNAGDLSVPAGSAVLKDSEIHPVYQEHGALYVDNDVKMRLKVELTRSTTLEGKRI
jgi:pimeloyl-ACP methyl ester carboxylesterase